MHPFASCAQTVKLYVPTVRGTENVCPVIDRKSAPANADATAASNRTCVATIGADGDGVNV
jgi:hypothetical protein